MTIENLNEVLDMHQRMARGRLLSRIRSRINNSRKRNANRMASKDSLESRARHAAIAVIRRKVAGSMGAKYDTLSIGQKMAIDQKVHAKKALVGRIAQKLLMKVKAKEILRFRAHHANEATDMTGVAYIVFDKPNMNIVQNFKKEVVNSKIQVLKTDGKCITVKFDKPEDEDMIVSIADALGVGIDIRKA